MRAFLRGTHNYDVSNKRADLAQKMEKSVDEKSTDESEATRDDKRYGYALELPYSKQNVNFKTRVTRIGRDLIIIGLIVCVLRTGYVSQWMAGYMTKTKEVNILNMSAV